ncbi:MAG TPA: ATP-binding protein [Tepidisphaeraceae bacterium]|jgi:signal transduction histidine kinase|nr:ATP-binding protein [Tepidisphaeraceae bacterium]
MSRSLRTRLLAGTSTATLVILGLLGLSVFVAMRHALLIDFDSALFSKSNALTAMAEQNGRRVVFETDYLDMAEFTKSPTPDFFEVRMSDGSFLAASPSLNGSSLTTSAASTTPTYRNVILPDGRRGREIVVAFTPRFEADPGDSSPASSQKLRSCVLTLACDTGQLDATLNHLRWLLIFCFGLAIVASGMLLVAIVNRAMKPVRQLAQRIESLGETSLGSRLSGEGVPEELAPIVDRLNGLFARLEAAFAREKLFTADVAHELRTLLCGLQTTLQVSRSRPRDSVEYEMTMDKCLKMVGGMHAIIESLLLLARADAGQLPVEQKPVDLPSLIAECWAFFQKRADSRGIQVDQRLAENGAMESDPEKLRIVLNNLFDNAVCYCDEQGIIQIEATFQNNQATVCITNSAAGIAAADIDRLFDRFWRADSARPQTGIHCGLGLSITRRLTMLLGGEIRAEVSDDRFTMVLMLPRGTVRDREGIARDSGGYAASANAVPVRR